MHPRRSPNHLSNISNRMVTLLLLLPPWRKFSSQDCRQGPCPALLLPGSTRLPAWLRCISHAVRWPREFPSGNWWFTSCCRGQWCRTLSREASASGRIGRSLRTFAFYRDSRLFLKTLSFCCRGLRLVASSSLQDRRSPRSRTCATEGAAHCQST